MSVQTEQNLQLQKLYILATGSAANSTELAQYNGMVASSNGYASIDGALDAYISKMAAAKGLVATIQLIAGNGFGVTLTDAQSQNLIDSYRAMGINTGSKLLHYVSSLPGALGATLDNRGNAASGFLDALTAAGKSAHFKGEAVTLAVHTMLQNIGSSATSYDNGTSGFAALSSNLSATGITSTANAYPAGATVFGDANRDGLFNAGEWTTTTSATGTYEVPNGAAADKVIAYGGTDLMTGNAFKGVLSSSTGATVLTPFTTLLETMVTAHLANTEFDASTAMQSTLGLPNFINFLSYNPLAVLASTTATANDKSVAMRVQATSQELANVITQLSAVIDNANPQATLQSAAVAVDLALGQALAAAAKAGTTLHLASASDLGLIVQAAFTATGTNATALQVTQIAEVMAANNLAAENATTITQLAQAADVAQGAATTALIAGALSNNYTAAVSGFTGAALVTANYDVTVGSLIPGIVLPATVSQVAAAAAASAGATAAAAAPTATLSYSRDGGVSSATTLAVKDAHTLKIIATFNKPVTDGTPTIAIDNGVLTVTAMTKVDSTHYSYDLNVPAGNIPVATVTIGGAHDATSATISGSPVNAVFAVDNTAPTAPTGVTLTAVGGTVVANTLNLTNTNLTATAAITAGQATGGSAVLKIGTLTIASDATILAGDSSVSFNLGLSTNAAVQAAVAAGGVATVTLTDAAGNATASAVSNPTLVVNYAGSSIALTTANDTLSGTGGNDTFTGTYGNGAGPYTFNTGDILNGLGGAADVLSISTGAEASTPPDNLWLSKTNFEKVVLDSTGNGAQVLTTGANFEAAFAANGVDLSVQTLLGAIDITLTSFTGAATIHTTTTGSGAHTITTGSGASTVNASGQSAGAQTINGVGLTTVDATIVGAGNQVIGTTNGGNLVTVNATIQAAGSQTIQSTSSSNVTIVASAASGAQTITTAGGNDSVTTTGAAGQTATIDTGSGNDVIVAGLSTDTITGGSGADTMTGGGGVDSFQFNTNGSLVTARDIITDFNTAGADVLQFGAGTTILLTLDATALVAGVNVNTTAGGLISFHASDNTLAAKIIAVQADAELDAAGSIGMFVDGGNTYVYFAGTAAGNVDDQMIQLTGIVSLTTIIGGATTVIS